MPLSRPLLEPPRLTASGWCALNDVGCGHRRSGLSTRRRGCGVRCCVCIVSRWRRVSGCCQFCSGYTGPPQDVVDNSDPRVPRTIDAAEQRASGLLIGSQANIEGGYYRREMDMGSPGRRSRPTPQRGTRTTALSRHSAERVATKPTVCAWTTTKRTTERDCKRLVTTYDGGAPRPANLGCQRPSAQLPRGGDVENACQILNCGSEQQNWDDSGRGRPRRSSSPSSCRWRRWLCRWR